MSNTTPLDATKTTHKNLTFFDIWAALAPSVPVLMQAAENDFGAGNGKTKMQQVTDSLMIALQIGAPLVLKNNPQHADAIVAASQGVFDLLKITNGLDFTPQPVNKVPTKD